MPAVLSKRRSRRSPSTRSRYNMSQPHNVPKEQACMLCLQIDADTDICGDKRTKAKLCVHTYCQFLASGLFPKEDTGQFLVADTRRIIQEAAKKRCFICYNMGASITCCETGCDRTFHLPCAPDGECVTQYFGAYRSYCWEHRPQQALQARPSQENACTICLDAVEDKISYTTMVCPACQDALFHRHCIQRLALHSGIGFQCPCCQNREPFMMEMLIMGIRLSKRPPSWESEPQVGPFHQRHGRCDAATCLCPGGREHAEEEGPWQLWLCNSCAAEGTHQHCSSLGNSSCSWECSTCAATETGSTDKPGLVSAWTSSQAVSTLSQGMLLLNSSCSPRPRQTFKRRYPQADGQAQTSDGPPAKRRRIDNWPVQTVDTSRPSTASQAVLGLSQGTLLVNSSCSPCPLQALKRRYTEEDLGQSETSDSPPAKRRKIIDGPVQTLEICSPNTTSQAMLGLSGLSQGTLLVNSSRSSCPQQALKRRFPEKSGQSQTSYGPTAKRRRIDDGPVQTPETSSPSTASQKVLGQSQGTLLVNSSCSSHPRQALKRRYPKADVQSQISDGPPAKRCKIDNGSVQTVETSRPSIASQAVLGLSQGTMLLNTSCSPHPRQVLKRRYPEEDRLSRRSDSHPAKRRKIDNGPVQTVETSSPSIASQAVLGLSQGTMLLNTSCSPHPRQVLKRRYPEEDRLSRRSDSHPAKRRKIDSGSVQTLETSRLSTASQAVAGPSQSTLLDNSSCSSSPLQALK